MKRSEMRGRPAPDYGAPISDLPEVGMIEAQVG
jgi:hypothetical protein